MFNKNNKENWGAIQQLLRLIYLANNRSDERE